MKLSLISLLEASTKWAGPLHNSLGNSKPYTVNYGTGEHGRSPMLYIHVPLSDIRAFTKRIQKGVVWFDDLTRHGGVSFGDKERLIKQIKDAMPQATVIQNPNPRHVGEAHITIVQDFLNSKPPSNEMADTIKHLIDNHPQLSKLPAHTQQLAALTTINVNGQPLFDEHGNGMTVNVKFNQEFTVWRSFGYRDDYDPTGPLQISLSIDPAPYIAIRRALGLPSAATIPGTSITWVPHIGVGYIANRQIIDKSYVDKYGSTPRQSK